MKTRVLLLLLGVFLCTGCADIPSANQLRTRGALQLPAVGQFYHGVFPGRFGGEEDLIQPSDLDAYEEAVGRKVAWVYFSNNWYNSRAFPKQTAEWIRARGAVPYIRMMLRSDNETDRPEPTYTLEAIRRGDFDADLKAWASSAKDFGSPILVEWGTEMNGQWFTWNAKWNGGGSNGTEAFKQTYRHIVDLMHRQGANNLVWVWHINADDDPATDANRLENYYPGDDYVDWIGVSVYAGQSPLDENWDGFAKSMEAAMTRLNKLAPDKPVIIAEFGASAGNPNGTPEAWADEALSQLLAGRWPNIYGFSWWNEAWPNDSDPNHNSELRVQKLPELAAVFKNYLGSSQVLDAPILR